MIVHKVRNRRLLLLSLIALIAAACTPRSSPQLLPQSTLNAPPAALSLDEAQRTAATFLNAWLINRYDAMYTTLSLNSRDAYSQEDFEKLYTDAEQKMTLADNGKSYQLMNAILQNSDAYIAYSMTFKTKLFGSFTDPQRTLKLTAAADGWRVAWSPGDIFAEMKDGGVLEIAQSMPTRANIYDRDGQVIADENGTVIKVTLLTKAYPTNNPEQCFSELARLFKARTAERMKDLFGGRTGKDFAFEVGELTQGNYDKEHLTLDRACTLKYTAQPTRRYVAGGMAPHIVGYVARIPAETADQWAAKGYSPDALVGVDGIERYWEETLAGQPSAALTIRVRGQSVRTLAEKPAVPSRSVYLTLDRKLQEATQNALRDAFDTSVWGKWSTGAAAVVMDVRTGEILAIASYPDFNVDAFNPHTGLKDADKLIEAWGKDSRKPTFNRATLGQYPPGSTFKIVSMAAAADSGKFSLNTPYVCTGTWNGTAIGDRVRRDWIYYTEQGAHGSITLRQALTGSCDTYFWYVGWTLNGVNPTILTDYARKMGLGKPTGIKDVGESPGNIPDPTTYENINGLKWRGSDALNTVIGQGDVQVTPLQMARMVAAVANGGTLYQPLLVKKTGIIGETAYDAKPIPNGDLGLKPEVLKGIRQAMCEVTTNQTIGTATFVFQGFKGAVVCGKTGTAQAGDDNDHPHAWFVAYAGRNADQPEIAIAVVVEHSNEGSYISAPIVRRIVETYYNLPITPWPSWYGGGLPTVRSGE